MSPRHDTTRTLPPSATVRQDHVGTGRERVDMAGDLDIASRGLLEAAVTTCLHRHPREVAVGLHDVAFMDCAGAAGLVACWSRAVAQETRLVVVDPSPAATRILVPGLTPCSGGAATPPVPAGARNGSGGWSASPAAGRPRTSSGSAPSPPEARCWSSRGVAPSARKATPLADARTPSVPTSGEDVTTC